MCVCVSLTDTYDVAGQVEVLVAEVARVKVSEDGKTLVDLLRISWETVLGEGYHVPLTA